MKATGIVRRIDDLGRVVIPKEIRRTLRIKEGDPLEIFTDREGEIILKNTPPSVNSAPSPGNMRKLWRRPAGIASASPTAIRWWPPPEITEKNTPGKLSAVSWRISSRTGTSSW